MNNSFDFKRFGKVLRKDLSSVVSNFGISFLVFCCIPTVPWLTALVFGNEIEQSVRVFMIILLWAIATMSAASRVYGKANLPREGVSFAMLPATNLEKFFSMVFYCAIVIPVAMALGLWIVDSFLAILPFRAFNGIISNPFADEEHLGTLIIFIIVNSWLFSALFMLGNMIFKRRKAGKTFGWLMLIAFTIITTMQILDIYDGFWNIFDSIPESFLPWFYIIVVFIVDCVLFYLTYRRIKNQKY